MKRRFTSVSAAAIALGVIGSVAAAPVTKSQPAANKTASKPAATKKPDAPALSKWQEHILEELHISAPGDEYFGRMKMSYLGINNTFHDDLIRAGDYTTDPAIVSRINFADEALTAWARKYPNDPQLARSYFLAFQMYRKVWVQTYQDKAWTYAHIVIKKWPHSFFGKALAKDLSIGFTEHYFAQAVPCESLVDASASPRAGSSALPSPSPTPEPTPTPTPAPGRPKVEILPAPCTTPPPTPTPLPLLSPLPSGSLIPSPMPAASGKPSVTTAPSALPSGVPTTLPPSPSPSPTRH